MDVPSEESPKYRDVQPGLLGNDQISDQYQLFGDLMDRMDRFDPADGPARLGYN